MSLRQAAPPGNQAVQKTLDLDVVPAVEEAAHIKKKAYPPLSSVPRMPARRIAQATPSKDSTVPEEAIPSSSPAARAVRYEIDADPATATVLYLAYGSNLCAETFMGRRGIRPLSRLNVSAPSLSLTFDLPGFPYNEPCFANTAPRKIPKLPTKPPKLPDIPSPPAAGKKDDETAALLSRGDPVWDKGLVGTVYEVTQSDYSKIIATEGGGSSYQDILVPCFALPPTVAVPEKPVVPPIPRPFLAHTLFAPLMPLPGDDSDAMQTVRMPPKWLPHWAQRLLMPRPGRQVLGWSQPTLRYLNLLRDGARENDLPADYQEYLNALHHYERTTWRQTVGKILVGVMMIPLFFFFITLRPLITDKNGKNGPVTSFLVGLMFNSVWLMYDYVLHPLFGDGEHTEDNTEAKASQREPRWARDAQEKPVDAEKRGRSYSIDGKEKM